MTNENVTVKITKTNSEVLAEAYPEQFARIAALAAFFGTPYLAATNEGEPPGEVLAGAFPWIESEEGYDYWESLSGLNNDDILKLALKPWLKALNFLTE